jgi:23S rRNA (uracil1939-C5)-methyltransferase
VARPALVSLFGPLRAVVSRLAAAGEVLLTETRAGLDLGLELAALDLGARQDLANGAEQLDLARVALRDEPVIVRRAPWVELAGTPVPVPPGAFLQATAEGEAALRAAVAAAVGPGQRTIDLYSGLGTLGLAALQAGAAAVHAVEADRAACAALVSTRRAGLTVEQRDLERRPLVAQELRSFDTALLDPPRAGARPQVEHLARSQVQLVVYAACDPASFARDARILVDGGFELSEVQPIDQFLWSAEIELVAAFRRRATRRPRT